MAAATQSGCDATINRDGTGGDIVAERRDENGRNPGFFVGSSGI
jgi:hypothetical protein